MPLLRVLISGAGVAGNALALWLTALGHDVTVLERAPALRATGLQVDLRGYGIDVLRRMGLEDAFRAKIAPEQGLQVVDKTGRRRAYFPASNKSAKGLQNFTTEYEIMRGDLCHIMYDVSKTKATYVFGKSISRFSQDAAAVQVEFSDGQTGTFDLLVGADGQASHTRNMLFGEEVAKKAYRPMDSVYMGYFTIPRPIQEGEEYVATVFVATGMRGLMTRRHSAERLQVYIGCTSSEERLKKAFQQRDVADQKVALAEAFRGAGWITDEIGTAMLDETTDFYAERPTLVKLDSWSKGRVTLLGDAAYSPAATTGMGTTSAMVGAYILAGEIAQHCGSGKTAGVKTGPAGGEESRKDDGLTAALEAYDRRFRPFMDQVQKGVGVDGWGNAGLMDKVIWSAFGIAVIHRLLGLASFLNLNLGQMFLKEEIKGWELPQYEEMMAARDREQVDK